MTKEEVRSFCVDKYELLEISTALIRVQNEQGKRVVKIGQSLAYKQV
jgi:hypothetical protein